MNRGLILPITLGAVMSAVFVLPKVGSVADSAISMKLPGSIGRVLLREIPASQKEVDILAKDTEFSKADCFNPGFGVFDEDYGRHLQLSVVLSGSDINNSIHRPERCMPAQGHDIYASQSESITSGDGHIFPARKLQSMQTIPLDQEGRKKATLHCVTYYFFVGQDEITDDHITRTLIDMRDRLLHGQDQRWAYVSASRWFSDTGEAGLDSRETAEKEIRQFLGNLADRNIDWTKINGKPD